MSDPSQSKGSPETGGEQAQPETSSQEPNKAPQPAGAGGDQERERWIAKLAIDLVAAQLGPDDRGELSAASYDDLFDDALRRAQRTLALMDGGAFNDGRDPEVHAYQLFEEGEIFTEEGIMTRFKEFGWSGLSSKRPVMDLMKELRELFDSESVELEELDPDNVAPTLQRIANEVPELIEGFISEERLAEVVPELVGFVDSMKQATTAALRSLVINRDEYYARVLERWHKDEFKNWCFVPKNGFKIRRYRPHEVLAYAATKGWLWDKLVRNRSNLKPGRVPDSPRGGRHSFPLFNQVCEKMFDDRHRAERDRVSETGGGNQEQREGEADSCTPEQEVDRMSIKKEERGEGGAG